MQRFELILIFFALFIFIISTLLLYLRLQRLKMAYGTQQQLHDHSLQYLQQEKFQLIQAQQQDQNRLQTFTAETRQLHEQLAIYQEKSGQLIYWQQECQQLKQNLAKQIERNNEQEVALCEANTRLSSAVEKQQLLINSEQRLLTQFENLANRIFNATHQQIDGQNKQSLEHVLLPLREQLEHFRRQVQLSVDEESKARHTLTHEIRTLQQLNTHMAKEAINLTQALKGNNKCMGNWGEMILTNLLDASGLRKDHEYRLQANFIDEENRRFQPDVIVSLPQAKDVVIDAKVSLVAYERYFNSEDEKMCQIALNEHLLSLRTHIKTLSKKNYHKLLGIQSLNYILMFVPIEPAFLLAINHQPALINEALQHNIMLVSPSTLLVALKTIHNLWLSEYQNENSQKIAAHASKLYDKLRLFIEDMEGLGQSLDKAKSSYSSAIRKLLYDRNNMLDQAEAFRSLGVEVKKVISVTLRPEETEKVMESSVTSTKSTDKQISR